QRVPAAGPGVLRPGRQPDAGGGVGRLGGGRRGRHGAGLGAGRRRRADLRPRPGALGRLPRPRRGAGGGAGPADGRVAVARRRRSGGGGVRRRGPRRLGRRAGPRRRRDGPAAEPRRGGRDRPRRGRAGRRRLPAHPGARRAHRAHPDAAGGGHRRGGVGVTAARRGPAALLLALVAALVAAGTGCASSTAEGIDRPVERVLIVSLPYTDWETVEGADMPVLRDLVEGSAIADVTTRIGRRSATSTDAYLTIGAGTRAVAPSIDTAVAVEPEETYGGLPAGEFLARRLGEVPEGIAYLGIGAAIDANESSAFGAEVGLLGDRLDEAGVHRAVVANADAVEGFVSVDPPPEGAYARGAATALMGSDGTVPDGAVGRSLLADDPGAAFGWRLDPAK